MTANNLQRARARRLESSRRNSLSDRAVDAIAPRFYPGGKSNSAENPPSFPPSLFPLPPVTPAVFPCSAVRTGREILAARSIRRSLFALVASPRDLAREGRDYR